MPQTFTARPAPAPGGGISSIVPAPGDPALPQVTTKPTMPVTGSAAFAYRPVHLDFTYLSTDRPALENVYQGHTSTVIVGDATRAAKGTLHTQSSRFIVTNSGDDQSEHAAYFGFLRYDGNATPGRAWFTDWNVHGAINTQQSKLDGITLFINNHFNGSPSGSASAAQWLATQPGTGGGTDPAHLAAKTYPLDVGLGIVGKSSDDGIGFTTGIQVGGQGSGWPIPASKIGTGILIRDYVTTGLRIKSRYAGSTGPALVVEQGQGPVGLGVNAPTAAMLCVDGTGQTYAIQVLNGSLNFQGATAATNVFTAAAAGDATNRLLMGTDGHFEWGDGTNARNILLTYRSAGNDVTGNGATLRLTVPQTTNVGAGLHITTPNSANGDSAYAKFVNDRARFGYNGTAQRIQIDDGYTPTSKDFALRTGGKDRLAVTTSTELVSIAEGKVQANPTGVGFNGTAPVAKQVLGAAATDAASVQTLVNAIRTALLNNGLGAAA